MQETTIAQTQDRTFAILSHIGGLFTSWVAPLVIYLIKKSDPSDAFAAESAREALNWQITLFIVCMVMAFTFFGLFLIWIPVLFNLVVCIVAAVKASNGVAFRYPVTLRLIK